MAASGAPFAISASTILGGWAAPLVSCIHRLCLPDFSGLLDDVGRPGPVYVPLTTVTSRKCMVKSTTTVFRKKVCCWLQSKMTALMILITLMNSAGGKASDLFGELTGIAVLLTMLPHFYSLR